MVMSLLSLQSSRLEDPGARQAIDQARRRIGALALVHRQLYDTGELASISSRALLDALCQQLQPGADSGIRMACDFDDIPVDIDTAVPLTLWMVEAVNNAVHHAFPAADGGTVTVKFRSDDTSRLTVEDDGIGPGSLGEAGASAGGGHGLRLIRALAVQLGGETSLAQRPEGGSIATLAFPTRVAEPGAPGNVIPSSH
jgi:two-component sensor histidine kinase